VQQSMSSEWKGWETLVPEISLTKTKTKTLGTAGVFFLGKHLG
jgi:hypothetical protein